MVEALLNKGFANSTFRRQILKFWGGKKTIIYSWFSFRSRTFSLAAKGSTPPVNPMAETLSHTSPWIHEIPVLWESIPARVGHSGVLDGSVGKGWVSSSCKKFHVLLFVWSTAESLHYSYY